MRHILTDLCPGCPAAAAASAVVAVLAVVAAYRYSTGTHGKWRALNVAHARPWPLVGNTFRMLAALEHHVDTYDRLYKRFADRGCCGFYQMRTPMLMVRDPALVNRLLVKDFEHFADRGIAKHPSTSMLAGSMFFATGAKWRTMRRKLSAAFTSGKLRAARGQVAACADQLLRYVVRGDVDGTTAAADHRGGRIVEVREAMGRYSTDVIGTCAFGLRLDAVADDRSAFRAHGRRLVRPGFRAVASQILASTSPRIAAALRFDEFPPAATEFFESAFRRVIEYREAGATVRDDVAQTLMRARNDLVLNADPADEDKFTERDIVSNAILMFVAGFEPVSSTLSFCLYQLALNEDIQSRQREEMISAMRKHGQSNSDFLADLHYTDMILAETERMYVVTSALFREAINTYHVPEESLTIEKGTKIMIPIYSIHHDPKYYPDPYTFDPQRFTPEEKAKRPSCTHLPFGAGPRFCIAKRFAELEMKMVLSAILTKFRVVPCENTEVPLKLQNGLPMMVPKNGIWLRFQPISGE